jgi:hypothetical protein
MSRTMPKRWKRHDGQAVHPLLVCFCVNRFEDQEVE